MTAIPATDDAALIQQRFNDTIEHLDFERQPAKDRVGTVVEVLGIEIDTTSMEARFPQDKKLCAESSVAEALRCNRLTQVQAERVTGFLSFRSSVVVLGRTHLRRLWDFTATFAQPYAYRPLTPSAIADLT